MFGAKTKNNHKTFTLNVMKEVNVDRCRCLIAQRVKVVMTGAVRLLGRFCSSRLTVCLQAEEVNTLK